MHSRKGTQKTNQLTLFQLILKYLSTTDWKTKQSIVEDQTEETILDDEILPVHTRYTVTPTQISSYVHMDSGAKKSKAAEERKKNSENRVTKERLWRRDYFRYQDMDTMNNLVKNL